MSYSYPPHYAYPSAPPLYRAFPAPPRLHWGIVLALSIVTLGLFGIVWLFVQGLWVKKVTGKTKAFGWCLAYLLFIPVVFVVAFAGSAGLAYMHLAGSIGAFTAMLGALVRIGGFVLYIAAIFILKGALEASPIDIPLSGIMTFFFGAIYFQYHLFDYDVTDRVGVQLNGSPEGMAIPDMTGAMAEMREIPPQS